MASAWAPRCNRAAFTSLLPVGDDLELDDLLIAGANLDGLADGLVGAEEVGVVDHCVDVYLVPREELVAAGRDAAQREVARRIDDDGFVERPGAVLSRWDQGHGGAVGGFGFVIARDALDAAAVGAEHDG